MEHRGEYVIKDGFFEMNFDRVTEMLTDAYWSIGIKKPEIIKGAQNSALVVGAFNHIHEQIGYSRVVSDKTRFAYFMDVIVHPDYRNKGIGQTMMRYILNHPELKDVYRWLLSTKDAHGVYQKVGFGPLGNPDHWMQISHERQNNYNI